MTLAELDAKIAEVTNTRRKLLREAAAMRKRGDHPAAVRRGWLVLVMDTRLMNLEAERDVLSSCGLGGATPEGAAPSQVGV